MSFALELHDLHKRYRAGHGACHATVDALRGVSLAVRATEIVVICGKPGAGKSTLLMCAAGLVRPDRGRVRWFGRAAGNARRSAGIVYRSAPLQYQCLTVVEAVRASIVRSGDGGPNMEEDAIASAGLAALRDVRLSRLTPLELKRVVLAEMLVAAPRLALLDDLIVEADAKHCRLVSRALAHLTLRGTTVLATSTGAHALASVATKVLALHDGRLSAPQEPVPRALELTVDHAPQVAMRLNQLRPSRSAGPSTVRVALGGTSAEEVLAECRRLGVAVHASRVLLMGSLAQRRVSEDTSIG